MLRLIQKPGSDKLRPIAISSTMMYLKKAALAEAIEPYIAQALPASAHGFRSGRSTESALLEVLTILDGSS